MADSVVYFADSVTRVAPSLTGQIPTVAATLASSFVDDPMFHFIFPQRELRLQALTAFFRPFVADGLQRGEVLLAPAHQGVCIWYPATVPLFSDAFDDVLAEASAAASRFGGADAGDRLNHLATQIGAYEPEMARCEVLWIGLVPAARGQGLGGQLIQPALKTADAQGVGSYLVSSNERNHSFYRRHGFEPTATIEISPSYAMTGMGRRLEPSAQVA